MTKRTPHPCAGRSTAQREAFEQIATGVALPRFYGRKTLELLEKAGLIVRGEDEILGRDRFGVILIPQYHVPIPIHFQWCEWCSENVRDEDVEAGP